MYASPCRTSAISWATSDWIEPLLASLPLAPGWTGNATTVFVGPHDHARVVMKLAVIGQDSVLAPDGNFDCWKVALQVGQTEEHSWVRKQDRSVDQGGDTGRGNRRGEGRAPHRAGPGAEDVRR